jgi:hypothetical protein
MRVTGFFLVLALTGALLPSRNPNDPPHQAVADLALLSSGSLMTAMMVRTGASASPERDTSWEQRAAINRYKLVKLGSNDHEDHRCRALRGAAHERVPPDASPRSSPTPGAALHSNSGPGGTRSGPPAGAAGGAGL